MILPELKLPSRVNQRWDFSGMDSIERCANKHHFRCYPHPVEYCYNSRGFRDQEWPSNMEELKQAVWCVGDSYTVGIGSPLMHTWPMQLAELSQRRTINVSMDGASNEWIARTVTNIIDTVDPANIVIMWSFTHRRENTDTTLSDEDRRMSMVPENLIDEYCDVDWENFVQCQQRVQADSTNIQFAVPDFHPGKNFDLQQCWKDISGPDWPTVPKTLDQLNSMPSEILDELKNLHCCWDQISEVLSRNFTVVKKLDLARDGYHFDLVTAQWVAQQAVQRLR